MSSTAGLWRIALTILVVTDVSAAGTARLNLPGHGTPPRARPHRRSGGEGYPPLPLPVTPVRRSERKREPAPPVLVAKIQYDRDPYNVTNDVRTLLQWARKPIKITYRPVQIGWRTFGFDPTEIPIAYITGHDPVGKLSADQVQKLRAYLYSGGTLIANACCGAPQFTERFRKLSAELFPDRPLRRLSPTHPIFHCYEQISNVRYQKGTDEFFTAPVMLEGVDIGCRTVVIFAPADLANGWYGQDPPTNYPEGFWIVKHDARRLGLNLITYILSNLQYARSFPLTQVQYHPTTAIGQTLAIGHLIHSGDWDPNPSALQRLQKYITETTTIPVGFARTAVDAGDSAVFDYPVIYIVGHRDFVFSDQQVSNLRQYLTRGGVLLAEACCGRREFDAAFRREMRRVLPKHELTVLAGDHEIYDINFKITSARVTQLAHLYYPELQGPRLEAINISGRLAVIYSPLAIGNGWEGITHPFSAGYHDADALRLGVNLFVYIMSH